MIRMQKTVTVLLIAILMLCPSVVLHANGAKVGMDPERLARIPIRMKAL